ncbi:hypothetical protein [Olsenella sp. AM30-3LB]|uniref:hypothetical protein n=1 Tax=Olsenella sp. AM30-3LB TaxID=2292359 RepID=UPI0011C39583|nr:hypothetical protein [Olsenella sp. AM30-3LB]
MAKRREGHGCNVPIVLLVSALLLAALACAYYLPPLFLQAGQTQEGDAAEGWRPYSDLVTDEEHEPDEPIDLTGVYFSETYDNKQGWSGQTDSSSFGQCLGWYGTMRVSASSPVWYPSAEDAGLRDTSGLSDGKGIIVVTLHLENVDARCRESVKGEYGSDCILLTMFNLVPAFDVASKSLWAEPVAFDAPPVDGLVYQSDKAASYTWIPQGTSSDVRIGYVVCESHSDGAGRIEDADVSDDQGIRYRLVVDPAGRPDPNSGLPVINLGAAKGTTGGDSK